MAKKILIVDDEVNVVKSIEIWLKDNGYDVISAYDGQMALEIMPREKPDLIILDWGMPKLDGYEVCVKMAEDEICKDIPVIMLTGQNKTNKIKDGMDIGVSAYVTKPFELDMLLGIMKGLLGEPPL